MNPVIKNTPKRPRVEAQPVLPFVRVIEFVSNGNSFSGWGPTVPGSSSIIKSWN
ncbi:MAG: hypothetical protein ACYDA5_05210 [Vulcanimicrobiaceae bacterium]